MTFRIYLLLSIGLLLSACGDQTTNNGNVESTETVRVVQSSYDNGQEKVVNVMVVNSNELKSQEVYFENGTLETKGNFKNGNRDGIWESFFENGKKRSLNTYSEGKLNGEYKVWFENGQIRIEGHYTMDEASGEWKYYNAEGILVREENRDS